jgi:pimeloyl-ACP methyl ester carboxylesterase
MLKELQEHQLDTGAVTINYAEGPPSGPPFVLLHGGSGRWQLFEDILPDLTARFHLYLPDLRGHGKSGRVPGQYRLQDFADDVVAFLRECVGEPAYLFGGSFSGPVVLLAAARWPDGVRAVVLGDAPISGERLFAQSRPGRAKNRAWRDLAGGKLSIAEIAEALKDALTTVPGQDEPVTMREKHGEDSSVYEWVATNLYHTDPDFFTALLDGSVRVGYAMEQVLPAIRCPVLLLQADPGAGGVMTDDEVARATALLAQPHHVRLAHIGHGLFRPEKEPTLRAMVEFLESL